MTARLHIDPRDDRPVSVLTFEMPSMTVLVGGVAALFVYAGLLAAGLGISILLRAATEALIASQQQERTLEEEDVIEARFVVLGRELDPHELPNRIVPRLSTAPEDVAQTPTRDTPQEQAPEREHEERPPTAAVDDILRRADALQQPFAEIAPEREREGSPDGIEEGTEREGTEGDIYRGRLMSFFRRGWSVPTTLDPDVVRGLTTVMSVQIGANLEIVSFSVRTSSQNALFDQSVTEQLTRLQASGATIPPPPEEVATEYIGQTIVLRYRGRDLR